jgi:hypothetical protein
MKHLIEFLLENGDCVLVEVDNDSDGYKGLIPAARGDDIPQKALITFEAAIDKVKPVASTIIKKLRSISDSPDEVEVEFGIKLNAEAGAVVAAAGIEANYHVTLKWKKEGSEKKS